MRLAHTGKFLLNISFQALLLTSTNFNSDHCAEMITVKSADEHALLNTFFKHLQYSNVWMGAQIVNQTQFTEFFNGENSTAYSPKQASEYNENTPLACATLWDLNTSFFWGLWCYSVQGVGCQRSVDY